MIRPPRGTEPAWRHAALAAPYAWLLLFVALPGLVLLGLSLSDPVLGIPPYAPLLEWPPGALPRVHADLENYRVLAEDPYYLDGLLVSARMAAVATGLTLLLAFPMALAIARAPPRRRPVLLLLVMLPFWTSFLIRIYAWTAILNTNGFLNVVLLELGLIEVPLAILYSDAAVYLGIVYAYLPFMILPIFVVLERLDPAVLDAAADLGADPWRRFVEVVVPLSLPGVAAGCLLVFVPALGEFVIPELLGGADFVMIGRMIWTEIFSNRDWPLAATLAVVLILAVVLPVMLVERVLLRRETGR